MKPSLATLRGFFVRYRKFELPLPGLIALAALALALPPGHAGNFSVAPVRIYMKPRERAAAITVTNHGKEPLLIQAEVWRWVQDAEGKESLEATSEVIVAPPIATLAPGARQVLRMAPVRPPELQRELTYRLIVREVVPERPAAEGISMSLALAMSMPVFITPAHAKPDLVCGVDWPERLSCHNQGLAYTQLRGFRLERDGQVLWRSQQGQYLLPGSRVVLALPVGPGAPKLAAGSAQLVVETDGLQLPAFTVTVP